jgi:hypothetical protein
MGNTYITFTALIKKFHRCVWRIVCVRSIFLNTWTLCTKQSARRVTYTAWLVAVYTRTNCSGQTCITFPVDERLHPENSSESVTNGRPV